MGSRYVEIVSPELGTKESVDEKDLVEAWCPIDGAQLIKVDYGGGDYQHKCFGCGARYGKDVRPAELSIQAKQYAKSLKRDLDKKQAELTKLEVLVHAADKHGLLK